MFPSHAWRPKQRNWGLGKQRSFGLCPVNIHDHNDNHHDDLAYIFILLTPESHDPSLVSLWIHLQHMKHLREFWGEFVFSRLVTL